MQVEMSLAELLINAIGQGRVRGVQFKRSWSDAHATWEDINKVIESRLDNALSVAREAGYRKAYEEYQEARRAK